MPDDDGFNLLTDRTRTRWWVFILLLAVVAAFIAYSFIGMVALGVFSYYATRPICRRLARVIDSDSIAAGTTVLLIVVPILLLIVYTVFNIIRQIRQAIGTSGFGMESLDLSALPATQRNTVMTFLHHPSQFVSQPEQAIQTLFQVGTKVFGAIFGTLVLVALALTLAYFLLANDDQFAAGLKELFGGRDTVAYAYAVAIDEDLELVFFGNLLFVIAMGVIAAAAYEMTNILAPAGLHVPMVLVLAVLTGIASLIPIVVGKVVYLPVVAYLGWQAVRTEGSALLFVGGVLVVYFLVLDILPQTFLQPYITGRRIDMIVMMFAYILGPILFGWYGFFLLPIVFIVMLEAIRIILPELVRGETLTPDVSLGKGIGTDPQSMRDVASTEGEETSTESDDATTDGD